MAVASFSKALKLHRASLPIILQRNPTPKSNPLSTTSQSTPPIPGKEKGRWSKFLLFLPGAITFGLGSWQILRRQEKIEMLGYRKERLEMEPFIWNGMPPSDQDLDSLEFRKVVCEGVFNEGKSVYLGPRSRSISGVTENGYYVITPLVLTATSSGSVQIPVIVNRGWVPREWRNKAVESSHNADKSPCQKTDLHQESVWWKFWSKKPSPSQVEEAITNPVRVVGVIRGSEKPSIFVPANDPNSGQWFYVDVPMIARACGLPQNTYYIEDINEDVSAANPYPVPKDVNTLIRYSVMPQDHLNYTVTWYSLSAALTYMALKRIRAKKIHR